MLKTFKQLSTKDQYLAGGKAYSLGRMIKHFLIPDGFVVLADTFDAFITKNQLKSKIKKIIADKGDYFEKSGKIKELIVATPLDDTLRHDILRHFERLRSPFVAVRSSATCEDASDKAWAGQLDTFLNVRQEDLIQNIKLCWASLFSERTLAYGGDILDKASIAVVVQEMVVAEAAGVAFSVNPLTQNVNEVLINAVYGIGEAIVSGEVTPDQYLVHKTGRVLEQKHEKQTKGLYLKKGKLVWDNVVDNKQNKPKLSVQKILELADTVARIERFYGFPVDVEFAVKKQKIYILQARPITTLHNSEKDYRVPRCFERPGLPLFAQDGFEGLMGQTKLIEKCFKYPHEADKDVAVYDGNYLCYSNKFTLESRDAYYWAYKRQDFSVFFKIGQICRRNYRFYQKVLGRYKEKIPSPEELDKMLSEICERMHFEMVFVDMLMDLSDIVSADLSSLIQKKKMADVTDKMAILSVNEDLTRVEEENKSMQAILETVKKNKNWQTNSHINNLINSHLEKFSGMTVRAMRGQFMTKDEVIQRLKENLKNGKNFFSKNVINDRKTVQNIFKQYHFNAFEKEFIAFVKEANFLRTHILDMYHWLSQNFMMIFDKIGAPHGYKGFDFRNMMPEEIIAWYYGKSKFKKREDGKWLWYRFGDERKVIDSPKEIEKALQQFVLPDKQADTSLCQVKGTVAYAGTVKAPARILKNISEVNKVCAGDVIICPMTWPSLIIALEKAAAFVTDEGGVLCHAAILARELKKPCITGTKNATVLFHDGEMVEVDGQTGIVRKI